MTTYQTRVFALLRAAGARQCPGCERPTDLEICEECSDAVKTAVRTARTKQKSKPVRWSDPLIRACPSCGRPNDGFCPCDGEGSGWSA